MQKSTVNRFAYATIVLHGKYLVFSAREIHAQAAASTILLQGTGLRHARLLSHFRSQ
jgi:hypothetical protein